MNETYLGSLENELRKRPNDPILHLNISNIHLSRHDLIKAQQHLYQALRSNPHYAEAYNNLGRIMYKQNLFNEAISFYEKALRLNPDYFDAHYNLGLAFSNLNQFDRARDHFKAALKINPDHIITHHNLGLILFEAEQYETAEFHLAKAFDEDPKNNSLGLFLGQTYLALGKLSEAETLYEKIIIQDPALIEAHHNLAIIYLKQQKKEQALELFKKTLILQPKNQTAMHMVQALSGRNSQDSAPLEYVKDLFDQYAGYYNAHVKNNLNYQVPFLLRDAVTRSIPNLTSSYQTGNVLDLGCGTGLCGIYFRELARNLVGVDISPNMIEQAKKLNAYDSLYVQDIIEYLSQTFQEPFDLIIAGDVLIYIGNLEKIFQLIEKNLNSDGLFFFTLETLADQMQSTESKDYILQPTGRFAHSPDYINHLIHQHNMKLLINEPVVLRKQDGVDVKGQLYGCKKA